MVEALREMLADGQVTEWEHRHFIEALDKDDVLTHEQKSRVREQIDAWFARDAGAASNSGRGTGFSLRGQVNATA